jgi:DNA-binding transcriptional LysR family regulator
VAPVVTGFLGRHPDASVDLRTGHVMIDLVQEGFDLAITTLPPPDSSLISRRLAARRFILAARRSAWKNIRRRTARPTLPLTIARVTPTSPSATNGPSSMPAATPWSRACQET